MWLVEGNDGSGVQAIAISGTGVTPPPLPPPSSPPPTPPSTPAPVTLTITTLSGRVGTPLTLATSGDPSGGSLSYAVRNGTATGCAISGDTLRSTGPGSCIVVATKSASGSTSEISSSSTTITFLGMTIVAPPKSVTIGFIGASSTLSIFGDRLLSDFARKLRPNDIVTCTGYAKSVSELALRRANVVARFLTSRVKVHIELETGTTRLADKVVVSARK